MLKAIAILFFIFLVRTNFSIKFILVLLITLSGCLCRDVEQHDFGKLSDEALSAIPYQTGDEFKMKHTNGEIITFSVNSRLTESVTENPFVEACVEETYEKNTTLIEPDYPIFSINMVLSNEGGNSMLTAVLGNAYFYIPIDTTQIQFNTDYTEYIDSLYINDSLYLNIMKYSFTPWDNDTSSVYIENIFYNYEFGLLQIEMSNEESYSLYYEN
ncbi:MAG: hypothetical protein GXO79_04480 [Chlorobi bacterium]|nr:hypothetical protein [Chlorobiota bacterium]